MGYQTDFKGELKFTSELTASQLAKVSSFLGEDCREHPEWETDPNEYMNYIDLELLDDFSGLKWSGAEKTKGMVGCVNLIIQEMRKVYPHFGLTGKLVAQGEDIGDLWELLIGKDGFAYRHEIPVTGTKVECPHCGEEFLLDGVNSSDA